MWYHVRMRRLLPFAVVLALVACSAPSASVTETPVPVAVPTSSDDADGPREETMQACGHGSCATATVHFTGEVANVMRVGTGSWLVLVDSQCGQGTCTVTDQHGTAWTLLR